MTPTEIGAKIKELRKMAGFTVEELAQRTGINKSSINQIELGKQNATIATLTKIGDEIFAEVVIQTREEIASRH